MQKIQKSAFILIFTLFLFCWVSANETISKWEAFIYLADKVDSNIPDSFKYIDLHYAWIDENSLQGQALQKLVYLWLINNTTTNLTLNQKINFYTFEAFVTKILNLKITSWVTNLTKKGTYVTSNDLLAIDSLLEERGWVSNSAWTIKGLPESSKILTDVYETLNKSHYDRETIKDEQIIQWAIKWAAESLGDKYTTYFPPVESKSFNENLDWTFEWIWAYIDMQTPWELIIISPIVWSPSEKAGIKWWDRVIAVDGKTITPENSVNEVVSWIKWPKWSSVELTIKRESVKDTFTIMVVRDTIIIKDVEHEKLTDSTYYIQIKSFWNNVTSEFKQALEEVSKDTSIKKIIFDVRNNPGWYLNEVSYMLSYFVPKWEATAIIDYWNSDMEYTSKWYDLIDIEKYEIVFLQNWWSASASEIMVGTMKDYFPSITIIWEKSFWKGSVQSLKNYYDWSTLKYTTAKWFTGKTKIWIDWIGITPDIEIEFDRELFQNQEIDNQFEAAKSN